MSTIKNHIDIHILKTIIANGDHEQLKKLMIHLGSMNVKYRILSIIKICIVSNSFSYKFIKALNRQDC